MASFNKWGIVPKIKKVNTIYVKLWCFFNKIKIILLKEYVPIIIPNPIGNKNKKLSFGFLKRFPIAFRHFSYKLNATSKEHPERPGTILKIPTIIPLTKLVILNYIKKNKKYEINYLIKK